MTPTTTYGYDSSFDDFIARPAIGIDTYDEWPADTMRKTTKLLDDLQANILKFHRKKYSAHIFITFKNDSHGQLWQARNWVTQFGHSVTSARQQMEALRAGIPQGCDPIRSFYLSHKGYVSLGAAHFRPLRCASFAKGFSDEVARFFHNSEEEAYNLAYDDDRDAMVMIASDTLQILIKEVSDIYQRIGKYADLHCETGILETDEKSEKQDKYVEWFGYVDGFSGPRFFPDATPTGNGQGGVFSGVPPLTNVIIRDRGGSSDHSAGSYLCFLKLKQDSEAFSDLVHEISSKIDTPTNRGSLKSNYKTELAEAYIMGRFKDGTPVTLSDTDSANGANPVGPDHDFDYKEFVAEYGANGTVAHNDDSKGSRCPFHAHIRKANPRTGQADQGYNLARRSVLYFSEENPGDEIKKRLEDFGETAAKSRTEIVKTKEETGMLFMAFQNNLETQFEAIVKQMHNNFTENGHNSGRDILTSGQDDWKRRIPSNWNNAARKDIVRANPLVHLKGGKYFFAPSISCLTNFDKKCFPAVAQPHAKNAPANGADNEPGNPVAEHFDLRTGGWKIRRKSNS